MPSEDASSRAVAVHDTQMSWLCVDVVTGEGGWPAGAIEEVIEGAAAAVAAHPDVIRPQDPCDVCIALSDDATVQTLNASYRGKDKPTNVLSFPSATSGPPGTTRVLGDVIFAYETVAREAAERNISLEDHVRHLTVHGLLHLLGYDHESEDEALVMERLEIKILAMLGVADPYGDHGPLAENG